MPHNFARTSSVKDGAKKVERSPSQRGSHHHDHIQSSREDEVSARTSTAPRGSSLFDVAANNTSSQSQRNHTLPDTTTKVPQHAAAASLPAAVVVKLREAFHMNHESIDSFWGIHTLMAEQCGVHVTPDTLALLLCDIGVVAKGLLQESSRRNESSTNRENASQKTAPGESGEPPKYSTASKGCTAASIEAIPVLLTEGDFIDLMARIATCTEYDTVFLDKDDKLLDEALFGEFFGESVENNTALRESITSLGGGDQSAVGIAVKRTSVLAGALPQLNNISTTNGDENAANYPATTLSTRSNISAARLEKFLARFGISTSMELLSDKYKEIVTDQRRKREQALQNPLLNTNHRRNTVRGSLISHGAFSTVSDALNNKRKNSGMSLIGGIAENADDMTALTAPGAPKAVKLILHQSVPGQEGGAVDEEITLDALRSTILKGTAPVASYSASPTAASQSGSPGKKARIREGGVTIATTPDSGGRRSLDPRGRSVLLPPLGGGGTQPSSGAQRHSHRSQWRFEDFSTTAAAFAQSDATSKLVEQQQHVADGKVQGEMTNEEETAFLLVNGYLPGETANNATPNLLFSVAGQEDSTNINSGMRRKLGSMKKKSMKKQPSRANHPSDHLNMSSSMATTNVTHHHAHHTASPTAAQMMLEHTFGASAAESEGSSADGGGAPSEGGTAITGQASARGDPNSSDDEFSKDDSSIDSETAAVFFAAKQETMYADKVLRKLRSKQVLKGDSGGGPSGGPNQPEEDVYSLSQSVGSKSFKMIRFNQQQYRTDHAASTTENSAQPTIAEKQADVTSPTSTYERRPKRQFGALTAHPSGGPNTEKINTTTATNLSFNTHMSGFEDDPISSSLVTQLQVGNGVDDDHHFNHSIKGDRPQCSTIHDMTTTTSPSDCPANKQITTSNRRGASTERQGAENITQSQSGKLKKTYEKPWTMTKSQVLANEKYRKNKLLLERQKNRASTGHDGADEDELLQEFIRSGGVKSRQAVVTSPPPRHWKRAQRQQGLSEDGSESPEEMRKKWVSELKDFSTGELHELRPFVPVHIQQVIDGVLYARQEASLNDLLKGVQQQPDATATAKGGVSLAASPERRGGGGGGLSTGLVVEDRPLLAPRITPNPFPKKIISKLDSRNPGAVKRTSSNVNRPPAYQRAGGGGAGGDTSAPPAPPMVVGVDPLITRWISSSRSGQ